MRVLLNAAVDGSISHTKCWLFQPNWLFHQSNSLQRGYCGSQTSRDLLDFNNRGLTDYKPLTVVKFHLCLLLALLCGVLTACPWLFRTLPHCPSNLSNLLFCPPDGHASVTSCSLFLQLPQFINHSCPPCPADTPHICLSLLSFGSRITRNICTC